MKNPQLASYSVVKNRSFPLKSGTRQGCLLSLLLFDIVLEVLATVFRQNKEKVSKLLRKKTFIIFRKHDTIYIENPKHYTCTHTHTTTSTDKWTEYNCKI